MGELAANEGVDENEFIRVFSSKKIIYLTAADFHRAADMGVRGFPTVILRNGENLQMLSAGFRPFDQLKPAIDQWLERDPAENT